MNHQWSDVEPRMIGLWQDAMLSMTDIDKKCFNGKHQACPSCGGDDRYRFDNDRHERGDGGAICSQCGSGNGIHWLSKLTGWTFSECVNALGDFLNLVPPERVAVAKKEIYTAKSSELCNGMMSAQQIESVMSNAVEFPTHIYPLSCGIAPEPLMVIQKEKTNGKAEKEVIDSRIAVVMGIVDEFPEPGKNPELRPTNIALIDRDGSQSYVGGRSEMKPEGSYTFCAVTVIGDNSKKAIYLCADWADAWHAHYHTGAQVWCCWAVANLDNVANMFKGQCESGALRMAVNYDFDELCEAEKNGCKVIMAINGRINDGTGFAKMIYDPGALLDKLNKKPA